ncbi:helix-turn-helix domain-containing protein [Neorhizobium sp. NPDC001467]|uniref:helix-turn-helix domain-containing protein n=1 Tax=Neorhizobium sp. NPDC001467 TaxID=3390595 RepID=UPI003D03F700
MTFQPRMHNRIEGFAVGSLHRRAWNGIVVDLWDVECGAYAGGHYVARDPRLFILLDHSGDGRPVIKRSPGEIGGRQDSRVSPISYVPAGMELWVDITGVQTLRHLDLHFDATSIGRRLMEEIDPDRLNHPNLLFADPGIVRLAELIAKEIADPAPLHDLYGDSLCLALIVSALKIEKTSARKRSALAPWQLRRAAEFLEAHCLRNIRLEELAELTGLSQSHFSHSFKASTGMAPHQWQMKARLDRAKTLLTGSAQSLTAVAAETGFADQAHFTRVFRQQIGTTPARWRRAQKCDG